MKLDWNVEERRQIREGIRRKYVKASASPEGLFRYPTGRAGLQGLEYDAEFIDALPEIAVASYCGVGNPFSLGPIDEGEAVLDIGCGGGVDILIAAALVGPTGRALGVDMTLEMLARAVANLQEIRLNQVAFVQASGEGLPLQGESFDVVISNGVFNLVPDKARALGEAFRVLRPGGRLMMADQVLTGELPEDKGGRVEKWAG